MLYCNDSRQRYTYFTSFLYLIVVFLSEGFLRALFTVMTPVSVLYHANYYDEYDGKLAIKIVDKGLCWTAVVYSFYLSHNLFICSPYLVFCKVCLGFIVAAYLTTNSWRVHEAIHVASVLGMISLCCLVYH